MDWDDAYNNGNHIPGSADFAPRWAAEAADFRDRLAAAGRARLDIAYGATARERFDLFLPRGMAVSQTVSRRLFASLWATMPRFSIAAAVPRS
jgi:hypothetical protein